MGNASVKAHHHSKAHTHKNHGHRHSNYKYRYTKRNHKHKHCHCKRKNCNHRNCKCKNCNHKYHGGSPRLGSPLNPRSKKKTSPNRTKTRRLSTSLHKELQGFQKKQIAHEVNALKHANQENAKTKAGLNLGKRDGNSSSKLVKYIPIQEEEEEE